MKKFVLVLVATSNMIIGCNMGESNKVNEEKEFQYEVDRFADLRVLRYQVPGFETLSLKQKKLLYYLSKAALYGRDITMDQFGKYNLAIRHLMETIYTTYKGDKNDEEFKAFEIYLKRLWFSNGIHHHYSGDKFVPEFSEEYFENLVKNSDKPDWKVGNGMTDDELIQKLKIIIFDKDVMQKQMNLDPDMDMVATSAGNFYEGVTQKEVEDFYESVKDPNDKKPISYGLNSKVVKENGEVKEQVYKLDGMYGKAIKEIVFWLEKAVEVAETPEQKVTIEKLISYYETGDLKTWDEYNIAWVNDLNSLVDFVNGFIEVYHDPLGLKASWESIVNFKNLEATKRTKTISDNAQWFEDHSPVADIFKKKEVKGVTAKVINIVHLGGECYPTTPIGINLPNADWIRKEHGSKSVTLGNITEAYYKAGLKSGFSEEFLADEEELEIVKKYGFLTDDLHTDLHECLGHGSGQLLPGVNGDELKNYSSALEETRADLFAMYYITDPKLVELGLLPNEEAAKAEYITYIHNGLMGQLKRVELGKEIEQAHMRCRQLISRWSYEHGKEDNVIEKLVREGKTYYKINDFEALRSLFGELLKEVQRIKSEGDYEAGKELIENYAIKVDLDLHKEMKERYAKLNLAPYSGFINPVLIPIEQNGEIVNVKVEYVDDYAGQMLQYSKEYGVLPVLN